MCNPGEGYDIESVRQKACGSLDDLRKDLTLHNVLFILEVRRNLISGSMLVQDDLKIIPEPTKIVNTKDNIYIGKDYVSERLFKINIVTPHIFFIIFFCDC